MGKAKPLGKCCPVIGVVLSRGAANGMGLVLETRINFTTMAMAPALAIKFRRAKKEEDQTFAGSTFAFVNFCPFCGTPTPSKPKAAGTTRRTPQKERA